MPSEGATGMRDLACSDATQSRCSGWGSLVFPTNRREMQMLILVYQCLYALLRAVAVELRYTRMSQRERETTSDAGRRQQHDLCTKATPWMPISISDRSYYRYRVVRWQAASRTHARIHDKKKHPEMDDDDDDTSMRTDERKGRQSAGITNTNDTVTHT